MSSKVDIANLALKRLGQRKIASLAELSVEGIAANDLYDITRRTVLEAHPWRFAGKIATLPLRNETVPGYMFSYQLPADCIRVLCMEPSASETARAIQFEVFGEALWTNDATGQIRYIWDIEDSSRFSPLFVNAFAYHLAADLAPTITGKEALATQLMGGFSAALRVAAGASASNARQPDRTGKDLKDSRR